MSTSINGTTGIDVSAVSSSAITADRTSTDGTIIDLQKNGTTVGSIGATSGVLTVGNATTGGVIFGYNAGHTYVEPSNTSGASTDDLATLGSGSKRFRDLYLSGGVYLGGTGSANLLQDFETGTFTPTIVGDSTAGTTTYAQQYGYYTKVGNQVSIVIQLNYTSLTGTGLLKVGGLPFTSANNTQNYAPMSALLSNLNWSAGTQVVALQFQNTSNIYLYGAADNALATPLSCVNEAAEVRISGTYFTS